jgi:hypothetical protein
MTMGFEKLVQPQAMKTMAHHIRVQDDAYTHISFAVSCLNISDIAQLELCCEEMRMLVKS